MPNITRLFKMPNSSNIVRFAAYEAQNKPMARVCINRERPAHAKTDMCISPVMHRFIHRKRPTYPQDIHGQNLGKKRV